MKALLMVGSSRTKGNSWQVGNGFMEILAKCGVETETINLVKNLESWGKVEEAVEAADLLILTAPVYADTLPAPTTEALIRLQDKVAGKNLAVILNCGYPESYHCDVTFKVCKQFAKEAGCKWLGGLTLGMGGFSFGKGLSRPVTKGMKLAVQAVVKGESVSEEAQRLASKLPMPKWLYIFVLHRTFNRVCKKHGKGPIDATPYVR